MLGDNLLGTNLISELNLIGALDNDTLIRSNDDVIKVISQNINYFSHEVKDSLIRDTGTELNLHSLVKNAIADNLLNNNTTDLDINNRGIFESKSLNSLPIEAAITYTVTTVLDENDGGSGGTGLSLREAVSLANSHGGADIITFATALNGQTINLLNGQIAITDGVTIDGQGASNTIISGTFLSKIFTMYSVFTGNITIEG